LQYRRHGFVLVRDSHEALATIGQPPDQMTHATATAVPTAGSPAVAVITRTRDRPLLLARAARSIAEQGYRDFAWVVVNDGGDADAARRAVDQAGLPSDRLVFLSHEHSVGMEAAANLGVAATAAPLLVIHDDDDSWHPDFLARTAAFLASPRGEPFGGVVTHADYVSEEIAGTRVVEHARRPFNADLESVPLAEMLVRNLFPPISFLFRRTIWQRVGGFNERLPVLGDWYFNVRFLLEADIAVLPERLARWHHRDRGGDGAYANSVIAGADLHAQYKTVVRNALVRDLGPGSAAGMAPLIGFIVEDMRRESASLRRTLGTRSIAPVDIPGQGTDGNLADAVRQMTDIADRRWSAMQLPLHARLRLAASRIGSAGEPGWEQVAPLLKSVRLMPPGDFDEAAYRAAHRDVEASIAAGKLASGYEHYIRHGRLEGRARPLRLDDRA
jgi:hypothetical protein